MSNTANYALGTYSIAGSPSFPGLLINDKVIALHALNRFDDALGGKIFGDTSMLTVIEHWDHNLPLIKKAANVINDSNSSLAKSLSALAVPVSSLRIHAPVENPRQILMSRANYRKHVVELLAVMEEDKGDTLEARRERAAMLMDKIATDGQPMLFAKLQCAVTGAYDDIEIPNTTQKADWELELAVVIGRPVRNVKREDAMKYVAGYVMANDLSNRDLHMRYDLGQQHDWTPSKCSPGYMPMGPFMLPADQVENPHNLKLLLKHNGIVRQDEKTNDLIHDIPRLIEYASTHTRLMPGDIISTGSPAGNGMQIGISIRPGDEIESTITGLGVMKNKFIAPAN